MVLARKFSGFIKVLVVNSRAFNVINKGLELRARRVESKSSSF